MITAQQFPQVYEELGINVSDLGCIMLRTAALEVSDIIPEDALYYANDQENHKYVAGIVSETKAHCTLLYGLMQSGQTWKQQVDEVSAGWGITTVDIDSCIAFTSSDDDEKYYCLVAELALTEKLLEGNSRLRMLPHIDTFPTYKAHITLAYIKQDDTLRDKLLYALNNKFAGTQVKTLDIDYGDA